MQSNYELFVERMQMQFANGDNITLQKHTTHGVYGVKSAVYHRYMLDFSGKPIEYINNCNCMNQMHWQ